MAPNTIILTAKGRGFSFSFQKKVRRVEPQPLSTRQFVAKQQKLPNCNTILLLLSYPFPLFRKNIFKIEMFTSFTFGGEGWHVPKLTVLSVCFSSIYDNLISKRGRLPQWFCYFAPIDINTLFRYLSSIKFKFKFIKKFIIPSFLPPLSIVSSILNSPLSPLELPRSISPWIAPQSSAPVGYRVRILNSVFCASIVTVVGVLWWRKHHESDDDWSLKMIQGNLGQSNV